VSEITLSNGSIAIVDDVDLEDLSRFNWHALVVRGKQYAQRNVSKKPHLCELMHRRICGLQPGDGMKADHKDGNTLDNRRENLRVCSNQQNRRNSAISKCAKSSQYKGVSWFASKSSWVANICLDGRTKYLGLHAVESDAARAYDAAARTYFGEFAALNFATDGECQA
jgi:hypothetical protein